MLLEQLKALRLHQEVEAGERFLEHHNWMDDVELFTWRFACGAVLAIYDGATDPDKHWRFAQQENSITLGMAPHFIKDDATKH